VGGGEFGNILFLISDYEIPNGFTEILHYDYNIFEQ
jgi:hypothetical protein